MLRFQTMNASGITNEEIPVVGEKYQAPCTETGYVASPTYLIPEYNLVREKKIGIKEAAIYYLDYSGNESMVAYYDLNTGKFIDICNFKTTHQSQKRD